MARNYTKKETEQLVKLVNEGLSVKEISDIMNRTPGSIHGKLRNLGIKPKSQTFYYWSREESEKLMKLADEGWSNEEIGEMLGRTPGAIAARKHVLTTGADPTYYNGANINSGDRDERVYFDLDSPQISDLQLKEALERRGWKVTAERTIKETL